MVLDLISLGDRIDIRIVQHINNAEKLNEKPHVYKSQVFEILAEDEMSIAMPIENGKIILLPLGIRYDFCFFTKSGLYHCQGLIKERYKSENIYTLLIEFKSQLTKFQRREYYRMSCILDAVYYRKKEEQKELELDEIIKVADDYFSYEEENESVILDISGGGIRVLSDRLEKKGNIFIFKFQLSINEQDLEYKVFGQVIDSVKSENAKGKFENRIEFLRLDKRQREAIVRYIFESERKKRKTEKG